MDKGTVSKLELNACLTRLVDGWDEEAARVIVSYFHNLPFQNHISESGSISVNDESLMGHTAEMGNMRFSYTDVQNVTVGEEKEATERVGQFKVWRSGEEGGNAAIILFENFWGADVSTMSINCPNPFYGVEYDYDTDTLEPYALIVWGWIEESRGFPWLFALRNPGLWPGYIKKLLLKEEMEALHVSWTAIPRVLHGNSRVKATAMVSMDFTERD